MFDTELHENCKRCGRVLKSVVSQRRGYGPACAKKIGYGKEIDLADALSKEALAEQGETVC